jgi:peptidylprolyl isomerase
MGQAKPGDTVRIHYTGKLEDGSIFDSSEGSAPLEFTLGEGHVIPGFETAVLGMTPGDEKQVTIPADDAYGQPREELTVAVQRSQFPDDAELQPGQQFQMSNAGQTFIFRVVEVSEASVVVDGNHPLAGEDLTFDLQLVEII